jgi:hypothetical protein
MVEIPALQFIELAGRVLAGYDFIGDPSAGQRWR